MGDVVNIDSGDRKIAQIIRPFLGPQYLETGVTETDLGIFTHPEQRSRQHLAAFLSSLHDGVLSLERGETAGVIPTDKNDNFAELVSFLSDILKPGMNGAGSYALTKTVRMYNPHNPSPLEIYPHEYDFNKPAISEVRVTDTRSGESLVFNFFPLRYSLYGKYEFLAGLTPQEALVTLTERGITSEKAHGVVQQQQAGNRIRDPYFRLRLEGPGRQSLSSLKADITQEGGKPGMSLHREEYSNTSVFIPLPGKRAVAKERQFPLIPLAQDFLGVEVRAPVQKNSAGKIA